MFALLYLNFGLSFDLAVLIFYTALFLVLMVIDLEHAIIPNRIVYPGLAVSLVTASLNPAQGVRGAVLGGGAGFLVFLIIAMLSRGGMGWGDVKMAALVGTVTGFPLVFVALLLAVTSGGLVAITLVLTRIKGMKEGIPFGPYLSLATVATLIWGNAILGWYRALFAI